MELATVIRYDTSKAPSTGRTDWVLEDFDRWMYLKYGQRGLPGGNGRLMYRCPCHPDTHRSLSARIWNGRLDLKCFAGCPTSLLEQTIGFRPQPVSSSWPPEYPRTDHQADHALRQEADLQEARRILTDLWENHERALQQQMPSPTQEYLVHRRIPIRTGRLVPSEPLWELLRQTIRDPDALSRYGFAVPDKHPPTPVMALRPRRFLIPYFRNGHIVTLKSRTLATGSSRLRYCGLPGWGSHIYIADAPSDRPVLVVEGELKALLLRYHAGLPCIAVPGVQNAHREVVQLCLERRLYPILLFDTEPLKAAVTRAATELSQRLARAGITHHVLWLPQGQNPIRTAPDDYLLDQGPARFLETLLTLLDHTPPIPPSSR